MTLQACQTRLAKLEAVVQAQRSFIYSVPDPDTRERAERHLCELMEMREEAVAACDSLKDDAHELRSAA